MRRHDKQLSIRVPADLHDLVVAFQLAWNRSNPLQTITEAEAYRKLLVRGLKIKPETD